MFEALRRKPVWYERVLAVSLGVRGSSIPTTTWGALVRTCRHRYGTGQKACRDLLGGGSPLTLRNKSCPRQEHPSITISPTCLDHVLITSSNWTYSCLHMKMNTQFLLSSSALPDLATSGNVSITFKVPKVMESAQKHTFKSQRPTSQK